MFTINSNWDAEGIEKQVWDAAHEHYAQSVADGAMEQGVKTVEDVDHLTLNLETDTAKIDLDRVKQRAREILRERLS